MGGAHQTYPWDPRFSIVISRWSTDELAASYLFLRFCFVT
jgi:hypothetical protein